MGTVEGAIKCMSGRLVEASHCLGSAGLITETVTKVVGTVDLELTGVPTVVVLTAAVASAFGVDQQYVFVTFSAVNGHGGRPLSGLRSVPPRSLVSKINVAYEVIVPPNTNKTESEIVGSALALSDPQSDVGEVFSQSMQNAGVEVLSVAQIVEPVLVQSVVVRDENGAIVKPTQEVPPTAVAPTKEADVDIAAVVGGLAAGLVLLVLLGGLVRYLMIRRKLDSSDELANPTFAV